jgi:hypothetical protein
MTRRPCFRETNHPGNKHEAQRKLASRPARFIRAAGEIIRITFAVEAVLKCPLSG